MQQFTRRTHRCRVVVDCVRVAVTEKRIEVREVTAH